MKCRKEKVEVESYEMGLSSEPKRPGRKHKDTDDELEGHDVRNQGSAGRTGSSRNQGRTLQPV